MRARAAILSAILALAAGILLTCAAAGANEGNKKSTDDASSNSTTPNAASMAPVTTQDDAEARVEGEKRFHANCSRCHQYPHKFPPRMFATIVRHMRVRATITDEDMRLILAYLTQ